jgi:hypothetical protein
MRYTRPETYGTPSESREHEENSKEAGMLRRQLKIALTGAGVSIALVSVYPAGLGAQTDWRKQWKNTVELAKKEGEIQVYGPHDPIYLPIWAKFQSVYPQIKFKFVPGRGGDLAQRISAERRAENISWISSWGDPP